MSEKVEEALANGLANFAVQHNVKHSVVNSFCIGSKNEKLITLVLNHPIPSDGETKIFEHLVVIENGQIIRDSTALVGERTQERRFYVDFLDFLKNSKGLNLTNTYRKLWEAYPQKYPV